MSEVEIMTPSFELKFSGSCVSNVVARWLVAVGTAITVSIGLSGYALGQTPQQETEPKATQPDSADSSKEAEQIRLFFTGQQRGRFASPKCRKSSILSEDYAPFARQVAAYNKMAGAEVNGNGPKPLAIHFGNSMFPGMVGQYLMHQGESGYRHLADLLMQIPFELHVLGKQELAMGPTRLSALKRGAKQAGLGLSAGNLDCSASERSNPYCEAFDDASAGRIVERNGIKVGLIPATMPDVIADLTKKARKQIKFREVAAYLTDRAETLRNRGADVLIGLVHVGQSFDAETAMQLRNEAGNLDLLVANRPLNRNSTDAPHFVASRDGRFVTGVSPGLNRISRVTVTLEQREKGKKEIARIASKTGSIEASGSDAETMERLEQVSERICRQWGEPLRNDATIEKPWTATDVATFTLNVMRTKTRSEVAVLNRNFFGNGRYIPVKGKLTLADIHALLPFQHRLVELSIPGDKLRSIAKKSGADAYWAGVSVDDGTVRVNGRKVSDGRNYTVATSDYVLRGVQNIFEPLGDEPETLLSGRGRTRRAIPQLIMDFVKKAEYRKHGSIAGRLDPTGNFPHLSRQFLWNYVGSISAAYNQVSVYNPSGGDGPSYQQSQLTVDSADQIDVSADVSINADSAAHGWDNRATVQYATARIESAESSTGFEETKDLIRVQSDYKYAGFREAAGSKWWVPMPALEVQGESEFTPPSERSWHKAQLTGILGARFELVSPLELKIGADARRSLTAPGAETVYGFVAGYTLQRIPIPLPVDTTVHFQSDLEYFYNDIGQQDLQELRSRNSLYYSILGNLNLTASFQAFLVRNGDVGEVGRNTEVTVGLNYLWNASVQSF